MGSTRCRLSSEGSGHILVSRPECLEGVDPSALHGFKRVCILDEAATESVEEIPGAVEAARDGSLLSGLHAKLYVADRGRDASIGEGEAEGGAEGEPEIGEVEEEPPPTGPRGKRLARCT